MRPLRRLLIAILGAGSAVADDTIMLSHSEVQAWASARLQPSAQWREPLELAAVRNDSSTSSDDALSDGDSSSADIERGGVPVALLDVLLAGQLAGTGRYDLLAQGAQVPQLHVRITRYLPAHRQGGEDSLAQAIKSHWHSWFAEGPLPVIVALSADWHDPLSNDRRRLSITVVSDRCLLLEQAPVTASTPAPATFSGRYRHSAIGQASLAAFNRLVAWLDEPNRDQAHAVRVSAVRGDRVLLQDPHALLRGGEELPLFYGRESLDQPDRRIGVLRIGMSQQGIAEAWPITMAAGSIRPGDEVRLLRPAAGPAIVPARQVPGSRCSSQNVEPAVESDAVPVADPKAVPVADPQLVPEKQATSVHTQSDVPSSSMPARKPVLIAQIAIG